MLADLKAVDLAIIEPEGWSDAQLSELQQAGTIVVGYVSAMAWADWKGPARWWWGGKERDEEWGAWWMSLTSWGWRRHFRSLCKRVLARCDGLFVDNLDRLQDDPDSVEPLRKLLQSLKKEFPGSHFVGNRGFAHLSALGSSFDGILFENLTDRAFSDADKRWVREQLMNLQGLRVYALDYETRWDQKLTEELCGSFPRMLYYRAPDESLQGLA